MPGGDVRQPGARLKPACPVARRTDYTVRDVPLTDAGALIRAEHYARGHSNTAVFVHGLFRGDALVGAALWLPPTKPCAQSVHTDWRRVLSLSLSRLALRPGEPQNAESILIGASVRAVRRARKWAALVTFADESQGHRGVIYAATNWVYQGPTKPEPRWEDAAGRQVSRLSTHSRTVAQMEALGYRCVGKFAKHRFAMALEGDILGPRLRWPFSAGGLEVSIRVGLRMSRSPLYPHSPAAGQVRAGPFPEES
jgi:hypothetical protein